MPSIYPIFTIPKQASSAPVTYGKELAFDFNQGEFILQDGKPKVLEGKEALQVWIEKTIRTTRFRFKGYTDDYGCELEDIIGLDIPSPVLESEVQRAIREALIYDERITEVSNFKISRDSSLLTVEFTVTTFDNSTITQEVSL